MLGMVEADLVGQSYEAAVFPAMWPTVLEQLAVCLGASASMFFRRGPDGVSWTGSERATETFEAYVRGGWMHQHDRAAPLLKQLHPGFVTDGATYGIEALERMPVWQDFLRPRGYIASAGTVIQGAADDALILTVEGFPSHLAADLAIEPLNRIRPHLARALTLSARLREAEAQAAVDILAGLGVPAAAINRDGVLGAHTDSFLAKLEPMIVRRGRRLRFRHPDLATVLNALQAEPRRGRARSVPVREASVGESFVLHITPLSLNTRDLFGGDGFLMILVSGHNRGIPSADLLRALFDLTPAEARLARRLVEGLNLEAAANESGVTYATVRSQLKAVFAKTGVHRQAELVSLLSGFGIEARA